MTDYKPKKFDLAASHPRPNIRPAEPLRPSALQKTEEFSADPTRSTKIDPANIRIEDLPPHTLEEQTWSPKPATPQSALPPTSQNAAFVSANELLRDMGLPPMKAPASTQKNSEADNVPYLPPRPTTEAEFSPPRPVRRLPTRFAHLKQPKTGE